MKRTASSVFIIIIFAIAVNAQTTEFTFQGSLKDNAAPANGNYDFEFALFDMPLVGNQIGATIPRNGVVVTNGIFAVKLDFGSAFPGADRFLEIRVRLAGQPGITTLGPRQLVNSAPYSVKSLNTDNATTATNALQLGGVAANQYVVTTDPRMTDARPPTAGSANYIQNTTSPQTTSNFNISGNGTIGGDLAVGGSFTLNIVNALTQYNIAGSRVLAASSFFGNMFAGIGAGSAITSGGGNSFFGNQAGQLNTIGGANSFFGRFAGNSNTDGGNNSFFGEQSGFGTSTGGRNSFFGQFSGRNNQTGTDNAFFGYRAGANNTASENSFFGSNAGDSVTSGGRNAFFGRNAGAAVITASDNAFFGYNAGLVNTTSFNSFFGSRAGDSNTTGSSNAFFGYIAGEENTEGSDNAFFGVNAGAENTTGDDNAFFGRNAGSTNTEGNRNAFFGGNAGTGNTTGIRNSFFGHFSGFTNTTGNFNTAIGDNANVGSSNLTFATAIGAESVVVASNTVALGRSSGADRVRVYGPLGLNTLDTATSLHLCFNTATNNVANCTSSIRYKKNVEPMKSGMNLIRQFRPVTYNWKESNQPDLGLIAEEVAEIEPLLITRDNAGQVLGVKYDQLTLILINAMMEQQAHIEEQKKQLEKQQQQIDSLKGLVCQQNPGAEICREDK